MCIGVDACVEARSQGQLSSLITLQLSKSSPVGNGLWELPVSDIHRFFT